MQRILKLVVLDGMGVMDRVVGVIRRQGFNIGTISAGAVEDGLSDIIISFHTQGVDTDTLGNRLNSLDCVKSWEVCTDETDLVRQLLLVRVHKHRLEEENLEGAHILEHLGEDEVFAEFTGTTKEIDALLTKLKPISHTCIRTGPICLSKTRKEDR